MADTGKLIVFLAFNRDDEGELQPAFEPREMPTEFAATTAARVAADKYAGVVAWSRTADPDIGEYGPPIVLFQAGEVPDLE